MAEIPIELISECFVKPKFEIEAAKQPYHLGILEISMLSIDPIQKGLLYSLTNQSDTVSYLLEKLKNSLSLALVHFYPLAGRFTTQKYPNEHACSIFIDCTKGPGARFIHATALNFSVSDIVSSTPTIVRSFFELGEKSVNYDGHTRALLSIQVTELQDGVFIGFTMNHSVVDGTSFIHFVSMLSEIFKSYEDIADGTSITKISRVPIFGYMPLINNRNDDSNNNVPNIIKLPYLDLGEFIDHGYKPGPLMERIFHFSSKSLANLKNKVNQECGINNVISSFQALIALVWRSITKAKNQSKDQLTSCSILVNARNRFKLPVSDDYFGNYISKAQFVCSVDDLLGHSLGWAALNLHKAIKAQDGDAVIGLLKEISKPPIVIRRDVLAEFHGPNNVVVGGSARFDMYGPEFGLGRALAARMGYANKDDAKVTANPGCEGGGGVDLEICLRPHVMASLEADAEFMSIVSLS